MCQPLGQFGKREKLTGNWCHFDGSVYRELENLPLKPAEEGNTRRMVIGAAKGIPKNRIAAQMFRHHVSVVCARKRE